MASDTDADEKLVGSRPDDHRHGDSRSSPESLTLGVNNASWVPLAGAVGGLAGATAIVYTVGGIIMWLRLNGAGVEANQALGAIPQQTLFAVGAHQLILPAIVGISIFSFALFLERRQKRSAESESLDTESNDAAEDTDDAALEKPPGESKFRHLRRVGQGMVYLWHSRGGKAIRRSVRLLAVPILVPLKWYVKYVPGWLIAWLPILLFLPNPEQTAINAMVATCSYGIAEWANQGSRSIRESTLKAAVGLAILTTASGLALELLHPHSLPKVSMEHSGRHISAYFIAVDGGDAYLVENSRLTIIPSSSYERVVVIPNKTKEPHTPSIISQIWP